METSTFGVTKESTNSIITGKLFTTKKDNYCHTCKVEYEGWHACFVNKEIKNSEQDIKQYFDTELKKTNQKIDELVLCIKDLTSEIKKMNNKCEKMESHIDFVENVYDKVRKPMSYLVNSVSKLSGSGKEDLPSLK